MNSEVQLLGITYSEFDNKVGPQLKYSYPVDVLSKEAFEAYSDYVIVSKQLCEKLIVVTFDDVQFLNYSVAIDNVKYHRNALLFAFGFVLARGVDTEPYGAVLEKIASTFVNLEIESEFLFQPSSRNRIQDFLRVLFFQLNEKNEAFMDLGFNNSYLAVKLYRAPTKPCEICDWDVPIFRRDRIDLSYLPWDISFQHLIPHIDGISHIKKIVYEVGMDIDSVRRCLKLLIFHGAILITDVFKFTNIYKLNTEEAMALISNPTLMLEIRTFSAFVGQANTNIPTANQIIAFLLRLQPDKTVQQILLESFATVPQRTTPTDVSPLPDGVDGDDGSNGSAEAKGERGPVNSRSVASSHANPSNISANASTSANSANASDASSPNSAALPPLNLQHLDISRLIAFAKAHGMIRRVHEYPMFVPNSASPTARSAVSQASSSDMLANNYHHPSTASMDSARGVNTQQFNVSQPPQPPIPSQYDLSAGGGASHSSHYEANRSDTNKSVSSSYPRSGNLPMPSSSQQGSNGGYLQNVMMSGHHGMEAAASVGLSGVLSAGTSLNVAPTALGAAATTSKGVGVRATSFGPATAAGGQERAAADALSALNSSQAALQQAQSAQSVNANLSQQASLLRSPRFTHPTPQQQQQHQHNTQTLTAVSSAAVHQVLPATTTSTTMMMNEGAPAASDDAQAATSAASSASLTSTVTPPPGPTHRPSLLRYTSRSRMTAGQNFLHNNHLNYPGATGHTTGAASLGGHYGHITPAVSGRLEVRDILHRLTGREHMDAICCRFDLTYHEIVSFPGVQLIYK